MALACSRDVCVLCYVLLHMFLLFFQVVELARKALLWQTQTNPKTNLSEKQNATTMVQNKQSSMTMRIILTVPKLPNNAFEGFLTFTVQNMKCSEQTMQIEHGDMRVIFMKDGGWGKW